MSDVRVLFEVCMQIEMAIHIKVARKSRYFIAATATETRATRKSLPKRSESGLTEVPACANFDYSMRQYFIQLRAAEIENTHRTIFCINKVINKVIQKKRVVKYEF